MSARRTALSVVPRIVAVVAALAASAADTQAATPYVAMDLGTLGGTGSSTYALNNEGQVVGSSRISGDAEERAFSWTQMGGMVDLGTLGGHGSFAVDVNDAGLVVGVSAVANSDEWHAFAWTEAQGMVDLGSPGVNSYATSVNSSGQIVGGAGGRAVLWEPSGETVQLGTLGGYWSYPVALSDSGKVVGKSATASGEEHAFFWTKQGGMVDLGTLGGKVSEPAAVSESGQVVGWSSTAVAAEEHAFSWTESEGMRDLGVLGGSRSYSRATAVNDSGLVVGESWSSAEEQHPFSWTLSGGMVDLGTLGGPQAGASDVNESGQVVGYSYAAAGGAHALLWTQSGEMLDLGTLCLDVPYCTSYPRALNDSGQVAGWSEVAWLGALHATLWRKNNPPAAVVAPPPIFECARGTFVTLDGSASSDPDGDSLSYKWLGGFWTQPPGPGPSDGPILGTTASLTIPASFVGVVGYTLVVDDGHGGTAWTSVRVQGVDNFPPTLSVSLSPSILWPPNHELVPVKATVTASDACFAVTTSLVSITTSEPGASMDIQVQDERTFLLRAERKGTGSGRVYSVTYQARENSRRAKTTVATATVVAPHSNRPKP